MTCDDVNLIQVSVEIWVHRCYFRFSSPWGGPWVFPSRVTDYIPRACRRAELSIIALRGPQDVSTFMHVRYSSFI